MGDALAHTRFVCYHANQLLSCGERGEGLVTKVELISVTASDIGRYRAECVLLPGCFVEGSSLSAVLKGIEDEIKEYVEQSRAIGWPLPAEVDAYLARPRSNSCGGS
jgi:predicted RNase H-like HicB family nuclease